MKRCINFCFEWFKRRNKKHKQWFWFIALWCSGLASVMLLGLIIRTAMGIN